MKSLSLAWRLRLLMMLTTLGVFGVVSATSYGVLRVVYLGHLDRIIGVMAVGVATVVNRSPSARDLEREVLPIVESPWRGPGSEYRIWMDGGAGDLASNLSRSRESQLLSELATHTPPEPGLVRHFDVRDKNRVFRAAWLRRELDHGVANVLILHSANFEQRRLKELVGVLVASGFASVLLVALLSNLLARVTLRPLQALSDEVSKVTPRSGPPDLVGAGDFPEELQPLVSRLDAVLSSFASTIERQRALVAEASHELRTPLAVVRSTLELSTIEDGNPERFEALKNELLADVVRMQRIIEQLVTLALVETGPSSNAVSGLNLGVLLEVLVASYQKQAGRRGIRLGCGGMADCRIDGDEFLLRLLFAALIENALQYGPARGTVAVALEQGPAGYCTVTVRDGGGRIPPGALKHLFDRFFRAEATRDMHPSGAGLGLAIAQEIATRHGGEVWVTSTPEQQTTFHVRLPIGS